MNIAQAHRHEVSAALWNELKQPNTTQKRSLKGVKAFRVIK